MKFTLLADMPDAMDLVAEWYYEEWGRLDPKASRDSIAGKLVQSMNKDKPPLLVLAVENDKVVGAAELKYREMDIYPDKEHWLGGLFVIPQYRGKGIGRQLIAQIVNRAKEFGIEKLYLQTEHLDGGLYLRLGWQPLEQVNYNGADVLVMERTVGA